MVARPAEGVGKTGAGQRARPIVIGHIAVGVAAAKRVQRHEERDAGHRRGRQRPAAEQPRSEEHTSELQSLMRISYAVFCLKNKNTRTKHIEMYTTTHTQRCYEQINT